MAAILKRQKLDSIYTMDNNTIIQLAITILSSGTVAWFLKQQIQSQKTEISTLKSSLDNLEKYVKIINIDEFEKYVAMTKKSTVMEMTTIAQESIKKAFENPETAIDAIITEELGIDKEELGGSAWEAAIASFILFAIGAIIPLYPFMILDGKEAIYLSIASSVVGLFGIGAAITLLTGKSILFSGMRQVAFGLAAAAVTYGIGTLIGVSLAG